MECWSYGISDTPLLRHSNINERVQRFCRISTRYPSHDANKGDKKYMTHTQHVKKSTADTGKIYLEQQQV